MRNSIFWFWPFYYLLCGYVFAAIHPSVVNVIGLDSSTGKLYGLGVTSADTPIYMEISTPQSIRVVSEADWDAVKSGCDLPIVIPLYPVHGNPYHPLTETTKSLGVITYVGTTWNFYGIIYEMIALAYQVKSQDVTSHIWS